MKNYQIIIEKLNEHGLKSTHQRIVILDYLLDNRTHPSAEELYNAIHPENPALSLATVYNTLDSLIDVGLIKSIHTNGVCVRYDAITDNHYHLYSEDAKKIEDYYDTELDRMLDDYFSNKKIPGFQKKDLKLQIIGKFEN